MFKLSTQKVDLGLFYSDPAISESSAIADHRLLKYTDGKLPFIEEILLRPITSIKSVALTL